MLQVKDAVKQSLATFTELFPYEKELGLRLEEVQLNEDHSRWEVTVSFKNPDFEDELANRKAGNNGLAHFLSESSKVPARYYKTISISAEDGLLVGIRNEWEIMDL